MGSTLRARRVGSLSSDELHRHSPPEGGVVNNSSFPYRTGRTSTLASVKSRLMERTNPRVMPKSRLAWSASPTSWSPASTRSHPTPRSTIRCGGNVTPSVDSQPEDSNSSKPYQRDASLAARRVARAATSEPVASEETRSRNLASCTPLALMIVPLSGVPLMRTTLPTSGGHGGRVVTLHLPRDSIWRARLDAGTRSIAAFSIPTHTFFSSSNPPVSPSPLLPGQLCARTRSLSLGFDDVALVWYSRHSCSYKSE
jgi:hypothetical protein